MANHIGYRLIVILNIRSVLVQIGAEVKMQKQYLME